MLEPDVEARPWEDQQALDAAALARQVAYLLERSPFYRDKLAGHDVPAGLDDLAGLPLTTKDELRATVTGDEPFGAHRCVPDDEIVRIYSTSGTTGTPSAIPLTAQDLEHWIAGSARSYAASGLGAGERVVTTYNAGPFAAGAALAAFDRIGACHVPMATSGTERLLRAIERLKPDAVVMTPSYAAHVLDAGADLAASTVRRVLVAGEPGGGEPAFRAVLEAGWGARVTEAMGIGDVGVSLWGECERQDGMHLGARGFVHAELVDPGTGAALAMTDGARGELVLTHLRHRAAPVLRFRTRDHVEVRAGACACGRTAPRVRCLGRTDDMLIVRGVNVFPSAIRDVVAGFVPRVSGHVLVRPRRPGVKQDPPLPVAVELGRGTQPDPALAGAIETRLRDALAVRTGVDLVAHGSLPRSDYKTDLVHH